MTSANLVEHFFRHEYGRLVAVLSRRVGVQHLEAVEDAVQSALMKALETWSRTGVPDNPSAWVFQVANNDLIGVLRRHRGRKQLLSKYAGDVPVSREEAPSCYMPGEVRDDLLRMLFVCCDEAIRLAGILVAHPVGQVPETCALLALMHLHRAVAVAEWQGPAADLEVLDSFEPPTWLVGCYLWTAVLADLHRRCGNTDSAGYYRDQALQSAPTPAIRTLLERRLLERGPWGSEAGRS